MTMFYTQFTLAPILMDGAVVEQVESFKFLGIHITNKPTWSKHTNTVVKGARQNLFPHRRLKRCGMGPQLHRREHPDGVHHCLVWQLLGLRPQGTTEGNAYGPVDHCGQASCHPGPLYQAVSKEGPKNCQRLQPP